MCYDISFTSNIELISVYLPDLVFDEQIALNLDFSDHIVGHLYGGHPVVYKNQDDGKLHCRLMEWGCIPFYVKEEKAFIRQRATMLNARSERILGDTKSYWYKIRNRRCLVPMTGTYEHRAIKGWKNKVPYFIKPKGQDMFFLPGLYSVVELPDKETGEVVKRFTYTLITRAANDLMKQIHNDGDNAFRMPLFLPLELSKKWLSSDLSTEEYADILAYEIPSDQLEYYPVWTIRGTKPHPFDGHKNDRYDWPNLPPLGVDNPVEQKGLF